MESLMYLALDTADAFKEESAKGIFIIAGDRSHPEVEGIAGCCSSPPRCTGSGAQKRKDGYK